jgi:hypothetical protein
MPVQPKLRTDSPIQLGTQLYKAIIATALAVPLVVGTAVACNVAGGFVQVLPIVWFLGLTALAAAPALDERRRFWVWIIAGLLVAATLARLVGAPLLEQRDTGTAFFGALAAAAVWQARAIVLTYADYLLADVDVPAGTTAPTIDFEPSYWIGMGYLAIMLVLPRASVTSATVFTIALSVWVGLQYVESIEDLKAAARVCRDAAWIWTDAKDDVCEDRAWKPSRPRWHRLTVLFVTVLSITLTSVVATSYWSCWGTWKDQPAKPYSWLYVPFTNFFSQPHPGYRWSAVLAIVLTIAMPVIILATILLPALDQVRKWEQNIRAQAASDTRSELDKLMDKCPGAPSVRPAGGNCKSVEVSDSQGVKTPTAGQETKGS